MEPQVRALVAKLRGLKFQIKDTSLWSSRELATKDLARIATDLGTLVDELEAMFTSPVPQQDRLIPIDDGWRGALAERIAGVLYERMGKRTRYSAQLAAMPTAIHVLRLVDEALAALQTATARPWLGCSFCGAVPPPPQICTDDMTATICTPCLVRYATFMAPHAYPAAPPVDGEARPLNPIDEWLPTQEAIEALPPRIQGYIRFLEHRLDNLDTSSANRTNTPQHVCGLAGYNGMIDPPCPACERREATPKHGFGVIKIHHMKKDNSTVCGAAIERGNSYYEWAYVNCPKCRASIDPQPECQHGHKAQVVGCVSCELLFNHS